MTLRFSALQNETPGSHAADQRIWPGPNTRSTSTSPLEGAGAVRYV
jgi:hypothetical protein